MPDQIESGNFAKNFQKYRGWVVGHFLEEDTPLKTRDLEIRWSQHTRGESKENFARNNTAKTFEILIRGRILFEFEQQKIILEKEGDYVFWDKGVSHRWEALEDSLSITIRWPSIPQDQVQTK